MQVEDDDDEDEENFMENVDMDKGEGGKRMTPTKVLILPLYSQLSPDK